MANKPLVSIVVLNWNGLEDTKVCLKHVHELEYDNTEVIVVDNGSSEAEKAYLRSLPEIIYVDNTVNRGFAGGQSDGYRVSRGEYILLLNNDAVIKPDYIQRALPLFEDSSVAVVGGRSYFWNESEQVLDQSNRFYSYMNVDPYSGETNLMMSDEGLIREVNTVSGSAVLVRRSAVEKIGYLHEPYFAYYEETDLFARMKRGGYRILYDPGMQIWHRNGASSGAQDGSFFFYYHIFRNRFMFAVRNFERPYLISFLVSYYMLGLKIILSAIVKSSQRRMARAYAKAIFENIIHITSLTRERRHLAQQLSNDYCSQVRLEQLRYSIVIDATNCSEIKLKKYLRNIISHSRASDVVVLTNKELLHESMPQMVRYVVNRAIASTHPLNVAILSAKEDHILIGSADTLVESTLKNAEIALLNNDRKIPSYWSPVDKSAILLSKHIYQIMGGFHFSSDKLITNIEAAAYFIDIFNEKKSRDKKLDNETINKIHDSILKAKMRGKMKKYSSIDSFYAKHYHANQVRNLFLWSINFKISLRLKVGRIKSIIIGLIMLNRKRIAIELKHICNEQRKASDMKFSQPNISQTIISSGLNNITNIPVYIICYERVSSLRTLVKFFKDHGFSRIFLIDNNSTYPPLLDYYKSSEFQVIKLGANIGHTAPWSLDIVHILTPGEFYIVSDPDVIPVEDFPKDGFATILRMHQKYPFYHKVGLGLKIDDIPVHYPLRQSVLDWEGQFWLNELEDNVFDAGVDTTLAIYKPGTMDYCLHPSIRTGGNLMARHLPWYTNPNKVNEEEAYYRKKASGEITSWNVDELPERYVQEMSDGK